MKSAPLLLIVVLILSWFIYHYYAEPALQTIIDDVQAYQSKSLLPEDN